MSSMRLILIITIIAFSLNGCAGLEVKKVSSDNQEGFRYYLPQPYLLVTNVKPEKPAKDSPQKSPSDSGEKTKGKSSANPKDEQQKAGETTGTAAYELEYKIIYLPNMSEKYSVSVKSGLGTVSTNLKIQDGWQLTDVGGTVDTKIPETINAISGLLKAIPEMAGLAKARAALRPEEGKGLEPGLYGLKFEGGMVTGIYRIKVSPE